MPADLAVIGLGHAGLPLAQAASAAGLGVIGYDPDEHVVEAINAGSRVPCGALAAADVRRMLAGASARPRTRPPWAGRGRPCCARRPRSGSAGSRT